MRKISTNSRAIVNTLIFCIVFLFIGLMAMLWINRSVEVIVVNKTGIEIENFEIEFTGGATSPVTIKPNAVYRTTVQPTGESHLELRFIDAFDKVHKEKIGVYFEPGYRGEVFIELSTDGTVNFEDRTHTGIGWR